METKPLVKLAKLKTKPSGALSGQYDLDVGTWYKVHERLGPLWVISTNVPGETCSIHPDHFEKEA